MRKKLRSGLKSLKGVLTKMAKIILVRGNKKKSKSILGRRKLDYSYCGYIAAAKRPPLASPKLEENSGVKYNERLRKTEV